LESETELASEKSNLSESKLALSGRNVQGTTTLIVRGQNRDLWKVGEVKVERESGLKEREEEQRGRGRGR